MSSTYIGVAIAITLSGEKDGMCSGIPGTRDGGDERKSYENDCVV